MKMNGIRMLLLGTVMAGGLSLSSCNNQKENEQIVKNSGINAVDFDKLKKAEPTNWNGESYIYWQQKADSVIWSKKVKKAYQAGKTAGGDSIKEAMWNMIRKNYKLIK